MDVSDWSARGAWKYAQNGIGPSYNNHPLQRELLEESLSNRELLVFLNHHCQDGVWYGDPNDPANQWLSPDFLEKLGYPVGEDVSNKPSWQTLLHPDDLRTAINQFGRYLQNPEEPIKMTLRFRNANGDTLWMLTRAIAIHNNDGTLSRMLGVHTDITELKHTEEALTQSNDKLNRFARNLSHELRQPLATTTMLLDQLYQHCATSLDNLDLALLDDARLTIERMSTQMDRLLGFSQKVQSLNIQPVDTAHLIEEVLLDLREQVQRCHARIQLHEAPLLEGDPELLRLLFKNLITNAIKYQRRDIHPEINIHAQDRGMHWEFSISDNGVGIDEQYHRYIFEQFARVPDQENQEGKGLGLRLCTEAVHQHRGHIWLDSQPGNGSTFYFTLPKQLATAAQATRH